MREQMLDSRMRGNDELGRTDDELGRADGSVPLVEVKGLCKDYGEFRLEDVSFDIPAGYICGFIGANGAGKTTVIKQILGINRPDRGEVRLFGELSGSPSGSHPALTHYEQIGMVMDNPYYVEDWRVKDVESALAPSYRTWKSDLYQSYLERFGIEEPGKRIRELSRGMKVKLQLAVALSHDARLLILDEPTSGLDPLARAEVADLLRNFTADGQRAVLYSTHITSDLEHAADQIIFIMDGHLIYNGGKDELLEKYARVAGGAEALSPELEAQVIGLEKHSTGWDAMVESATLKALCKGERGRDLLVEPVNMEEIMVYMNRKAA